MRRPTALLAALLAMSLTGCAFIVTEETAPESDGSSNEAPEVSLAVQPSQPDVGDTVMLDAGETTDADADALRYYFTVRNDEDEVVHETEADGWTTSFEARRASPYYVRLTVVDEHGAKSSVTTTVRPQNRSPKVRGSWVLHDGDEVVARGTDSGGVRAVGGGYDRLTMSIDRIEDPEGDETSVRWYIERAPKGFTGACENGCGGMQYELDLTQSGVYDGRAVVRDEHGAKSTFEFYVKK